MYLVVLLLVAVWLSCMTIVALCAQETVCILSREAPPAMGLACGDSTLFESTP